MVNFENGVTPMNDANLNKMQTDLEKQIKGTILYQDTIGTNESVTFNGTIDEGDYIEILYCRRKVSDGTSIIKTTGKLPFTNGMMTNLDINYFSFPENQQSISKSVTINGDGITVNGENTWGNVIGFEVTNTIYILKVKKYKE